MQVFFNPFYDIFVWFDGDVMISAQLKGDIQKTIHNWLAFS